MWSDKNNKWSWQSIKMNYKFLKKFKIKIVQEERLYVRKRRS